MTRIEGPIWVVQPGGDEAPAHPIVLPPDTDPDAPAAPSHPIVLPPELVDPGWGVSVERPDQGLPGAGGDEHPDQGLPGDQPGPSHPIYVNPYPDQELPDGADEVGELAFYQRKAIGINWDPELLKPSVVVGIYVVEGDDSTLVRTVANTGASSVTFPQDFTGTRLFRVAGADGYCEGEVTVK